MGLLADSSTWSTVLVALVAILIVQKVVANYRWHKKYKLPNPVPGIPIFGNTFQLPPMQQGTWGQEMTKKYGEMYTCKFGVTNWVFLNSTRVVNDLMEKRSAIYSSRQNLPMASGIMSGGCRILLMPYSDRWRAIRKVMHTILNTQNKSLFAPFQDLESRHLLYDYLHNPDQWYVANQRYANSVIMSVVFGKRFELGSKDTRELLETSTEILMALQPGASIVDALPILDKLPKALQWWRPRGLRAHEKCKKVYRREVEDLNRRIKDGTARDCYALQFMKSPEAHKFGETQFLFSLGSIMEAGSDTSRIAISQVIAAAALDKRWVNTLRSHLDRVCPNASRLPSFSDRPSLPYMSAVAKEAMRWRPMAQIGFPTMLTTDDEYEGYRFPAGTVFTWNALTIALDEKEFEDPMRFWPERFMDGNEENVLKGHLGFGPGRRMCSGYHVGDTNVWIAVARLMYCFDFEPVPGKPIDTVHSPWLEYRYAPIDITLKVRSPAHAALIDRECKAAVDTKY
ncbi:cytochrome P450 [Tricladium varicosporioides]|nr:cytochrome P450 [Hymenoscyphus varicosporioides]